MPIQRCMRFLSQPKCASVSQPNCFFTFTYFTLDKFDKIKKNPLNLSQTHCDARKHTYVQLTVCSVRMRFC